MSIELSLEDVKRVALHYGFHIEVIPFSLFYLYHMYRDIYICMYVLITCSSTAEGNDH